MKVEILEQRQLLAGMYDDGSVLLTAGSANFVDNETEFQGNVYNGFELVSSLATFKADPGEITRISFLDPDGDLVFAEFSSDSAETSLTISLSNFSPEVASPYMQPGTTYAQGLASFTIENSTLLTYFSVFSLGTDVNRVDPALFQADDLSFVDPANNIAADGMADVQNVIVVPITGRASHIGGINAANANFISGVGVVGIAADDILFGDFNDATGAGGLLIGNITPSGTAQAWVRISPFSVLDEIQINGGDLAGVAASGIKLDTNMHVWSFAARDGRLSIEGVDAVNNGRDLQVAARGFFDDPDNGDTYFMTPGQGVSRGSASEIMFMATDQDQDAFDAFFLGNTFDFDVVIKGVVDPGIDIRATGFYAALVVEGDIMGVDDDNLSIIAAGFFGDVIIGGDFNNALLTTDTIVEELAGKDGDIVQQDTWQAGEGGIKSVTIEGTMGGGEEEGSATAIEANWIGSVWIGEIAAGITLPAGDDTNAGDDGLSTTAGAIISIIGNAAEGADGYVDTIHVDKNLDLSDNDDAWFVRTWDGWVGTITFGGDATSGTNPLIQLNQLGSYIPGSDDVTAKGSVNFPLYVEFVPEDGDTEQTFAVGGITAMSITNDQLVETGMNADKNGESETLADVGQLTGNASPDSADNGNVVLKGQPAGHVNDIAGITAWDGDVVIGDTDNTFTIEGSLGLVKAMDREGDLHEPAAEGLTLEPRDDNEEDIELVNDLMAKTMWGFEATHDISLAKVEADTVSMLHAGNDIEFNGDVTVTQWFEGASAKRGSITVSGDITANEDLNLATASAWIGSFTAGKNIIVGNPIMSETTIGQSYAFRAGGNIVFDVVPLPLITEDEPDPKRSESIVTAVTGLGRIDAGGMITINDKVDGGAFIKAISADGGMTFEMEDTPLNEDDVRYGRFTAEQLGDVTVTDGRLIGADNNIEFYASDGSIGDINISFTATDNEQALMTDIIFQAGYDGPSGRADAAEVSIGDITLTFTNPDLQQEDYVAPTVPIQDPPPAPAAPDKHGDWNDLAFFESTAVATDADSGTGFAAEGNIGNVRLISSIYSGTVMFVDGNGDPMEDTDNSDENILLMRGANTGVLIAAGDGDFGAIGGIDGGIGKVGTGGASIGDVMVTARLEDFGPDTPAAGRGIVIAAGIRPSAPGVYASGDTDGINHAVSKFVGSSIGAIDFTDTDEMPTRETPSSLQILSEITGTGDAIPVIISDVIESVSLSDSTGSVLGSAEPTSEDIIIFNTDEDEEDYGSGDLVIIAV
jgi:hypothetical protein